MTRRTFNQLHASLYMEAEAGVEKRRVCALKNSRTEKNLKPSDYKIYSRKKQNRIAPL
ncbi:MAG: hypothetical protein WC374_11875 [Phycisphaerae bacterium]